MTAPGVTDSARVAKKIGGRLTGWADSTEDTTGSATFYARAARASRGRGPERGREGNDARADRSISSQVAGRRSGGSAARREEEGLGERPIYRYTIYACRDASLRAVHSHLRGL